MPRRTVSRRCPVGKFEARRRLEKTGEEGGEGNWVLGNGEKLWVHAVTQHRVQFCTRVTGKEKTINNEQAGYTVVPGQGRGGALHGLHRKDLVAFFGFLLIFIYCWHSRKSLVYITAITNASKSRLPLTQREISPTHHTHILNGFSNSQKASIKQHGPRTGCAGCIESQNGGIFISAHRPNLPTKLGTGNIFAL